MFFQRKALNKVDIAQCNPIIVNQTDHSIVLFLDRGVLYNKQVLAPGEAVGMTRKETYGIIAPYRIHALVGDEKSLPTRTQSVKNLLSTAVIPTAFIVGTMAAASTAGTMTGPASALTRVTGGMVIRGMVIDSAALAAGSLTASRAAFIADKLIEKHPENFSAKSGHFMPGNRFVVIRGGIEEPLTITTLTEKEFRTTVTIQGDIKTPLDTLQDKIEYYTPNMLRWSSTTTVLAEIDETDARDTITSGSQEAQPPLPIEPQQEREAAPPADSPKEGATTDSTTEEDEEEQMRKAITESLQMEEDRKQRDKEYSTRLKEGKRIPVVLF